MTEPRGNGPDGDPLLPGDRFRDRLDDGRISPSWGEISDPERFLPPLTFGELELAHYLDDSLPGDWRIYVRPHLDADRPLLAALHRSAGGMFWDVVDWDLSEFQVVDGVWVTRERRFGSPYRFMNEVRARVYGVFVPEIGEALNADNRGMYEPVHGSAPDIAGRGLANPLATVLSLAMMLRYSLGHGEVADRVEAAVSAVLDQGLRTADIMSPGMRQVGTVAMGDAVVMALRAAAG